MFYNSFTEDISPEVFNTTIDFTVAQTMEEIHQEEREVSTFPFL